MAYRNHAPVRTLVQATAKPGDPHGGGDRERVREFGTLMEFFRKILEGDGTVLRAGVPYSEDLVRQRGEPFSYDIDTERAVIAAVRSGDQAQLERLMEGTDGGELHRLSAPPAAGAHAPAAQAKGRKEEKFPTHP